MADRMGTLQQRYRQHQAAMRGTNPNIPLTVVEMSNKQSEIERENEMKQQRARSNSMANSSFTNLPDQHLVSMAGMLWQNAANIMSKRPTKNKWVSGHYIGTFCIISDNKQKISGSILTTVTNNIKKCQ